MMDKIIFEHPDGHIEITTVVERLRRQGEPVETFLERMAQKVKAECPHLAQAVRRGNMPPEAIPQDRTFRQAWRLASGGVNVDMPLAREVQKARLRELRAPLLERLDVEAARAQEEGDDAKLAAIVAKKQALRDVTAHPSLAAARTPEELKQAGLAVLASNAAVRG